MVCRRLELAELLEREGIILEEDGETRRALVRATADARQAAPLDLAIVLVKSYDTPAAACSLQSALAPGSHVLSLQNGLRNVETLAEKLGEERILGGVTSQGATLLGPGHVRHAGSGPTVIAESHARADSSRARQTARLLARAGIATTVSDDLRSLLWGKLVVSTAANGLTALSGLRNGELLESPLSLIMDDLARETAAVAAAVGVSLPYADPVKHTRSVMLATAPNRSSMLQDIEAGRPTEVGALNQAVGVEGARLGVPTPLNHALSILIREFEGRAK
jgi:2-dehydropantoate 2-reductase